MPQVRYSVPGVPAEESAGLNAFTPHFNRQAGGGAQAYKYAVAGYPGTRAIPAPVVNTQISADAGDLALAGTARSSDAPPVFYPNQYYQGYAAEYPGAGMPIWLVDPANPGPASLLPAPAGDLTGRLRGRQAMSPATGVVQRVRSLPWFPRLYSSRPE